MLRIGASTTHARTWEVRRAAAPPPIRRGLGTRVPPPLSPDRRASPSPLSSSLSSSRCAASASALGTTATDEAPASSQPEPQPQLQWRDCWYAVAFEADLDKSAPAPFTLLGEKIVIWWDGTSSSGSSSSSSSTSSGGGGQWRAFADACPHKLALLSEGRIASNGELECPYHGWRWKGDGACTAIPQGGDPSAPRACSTTFPCVSAQGIVFVRPAPSNAAGGAANGNDSPPENPPPLPLPLVPELEEGGRRAWLGEGDMVVSDTWRDIPLDYATVMSNLLDASHVPFTHHRSISNRNVPNVYDVSLDGPISARGFSGVWKTGPRNGALGAQAGAFLAPNLMRQKIDGRERRGVEAMVVAYVTPSAPGRCRLLNRNTIAFVGKGAKGDGGGGGGEGTSPQQQQQQQRQGGRPLPAVLAGLLPRFASHLATQAPLEDDQIFLHGAEAELWRRRAAGDARAQYLPSPGADAFERSFRAWLAAHASGGPFGAPGRDASAALPPRLSRSQLLDRWEQHTQNCATCLRALARVRAARRGARAAAAVFALLAAFSGAVAVTAGAGAGVGAGAGATASSAASSAAAAAAAPASLAEWARGLGGRALGVLLAAGAGVAGVSSSPETAAARALLFALVAVGSAAAASALARLEEAFLRGTWPPPRNLDKD